MKPVVRLLAVFSLFLAAPLVYAEDYPTRPIHVIVGLSAGSGVDVMARVVGQKLSEKLGQAVIVENKPGAGSNIATKMAASADPDGYTVFVTTVANAINATLYKNLTFDVLKDFTPIILGGKSTNLLVVNPQVQAKTVGELIEFAKRNPKKLNAGSSGVGTVPYLAGEMFRHKTGIEVVHVPFKGGPEATTALLAGQIDYLFAITPTVMGHVKSGRLRALAVTSEQRSDLLPDVPTMIESGVKDFEAVTWFGYSVPTGTPKPVVDRLNSELGKILADNDVKLLLAKQGIETVGGSPQQFAEYMKREFVKWGELVKLSGATVE